MTGATTTDTHPRDLVLRHVLIFHRHGDRAPVLTSIGDKWKMTPDELAFWSTKVATIEQLAEIARAGTVVGADPSLPPPPASTRPYTHPLGSLTQKGVEHMRNKGKQLQKQYGHLVADTPPSSRADAIYVLSSSVPRCVESIQCLLHGMFYSDDNVVNDDATSIPIRTYARNVLAPNHSLRVFFEIEAIVRADIALRPLAEQQATAALAQHLRTTLGIAADKTLPWTAIRDGLTCRLAHGLPLPDGVTHAIVDQIDAYDAWLWHRLYAQRTFCFDAFALGVQQVYDHLQRVVYGAAATPKLSFFSAHDNSIVALVRALQLQVGDALPEYGSIVAFEIYGSTTTQQQHFVRVLFDDRIVTFAGHEQDEMCPFEVFEALALAFLTPAVLPHEEANDAATTT